MGGVIIIYIGRYHSVLFAMCICLGLLLSWFFSEHQHLTGDQTQMLYKGYLGVYEGVWLSYGNAASAVGNVPGSLSAWLIGGPLLLWDSPYAPMVLLLAMRLVGFLLFDAVIRQVFVDPVSKGNARLLFLVLCWLNPWFQYESLLYNPSYLFLFSAMHCWSAWHMRERASFWHMIVHLLAIGMAMQLHYSWPLLAVISTYLFWRRILKVSWSGVVVATLLIGASLIPYAMEVMSNSHLTQNGDPEARQRYIGWGSGARLSGAEIGDLLAALWLLAVCQQAGQRHPVYLVGGERISADGRDLAVAARDLRDGLGDRIAGSQGQLAVVARTQTASAA